ncbi:hypothetical protein QJS66_04920 [Kocuria rhizophila]|nr:hypothetical protein QJS66_04920 [Kocuria rhizophila]
MLLKPAGLGSPVARLADFGIRIRLDDARLTHTGTVGGGPPGLPRSLRAGQPLAEHGPSTPRVLTAVRIVLPEVEPQHNRCAGGRGRAQALRGLAALAPGWRGCWTGPEQRVPGRRPPAGAAAGHGVRCARTGQRRPRRASRRGLRRPRATTERELFPGGRRRPPAGSPGAPPTPDCVGTPCTARRSPLRSARDDRARGACCAPLPVGRWATTRSVPPGVDHPGPSPGPARGGAARSWSDTSGPGAGAGVRLEGVPPRHRGPRRRGPSRRPV